MEAKFNIKRLIATIAIALHTSIAFAQFQMSNGTPFNYGRTNPTSPAFNPAAIGIGDFPNGTPPLSALHINTNAPFPTNTTFFPGETFRTHNGQDEIRNLCPTG